MFAVSMRFIPQSSALFMMSMEAFSLICPPKLFVPRQICETLRPDLPRFL